MTLLEEPVATPQPAAPSAPPMTKGRLVVSWLTSTDHKVIGNLYFITSFVFFLLGGVMALVIRAELTDPGMQLVSLEQYNQLFTMHGTVMLFLFATPLFSAFANAIMPLQIGSPDVAFPRLNMIAYWLFAFGGLIVMLSFLTPGGAAAFGWTAYAPLSDAVRSPGAGADMWLIGLAHGWSGHHLGCGQLHHHHRLPARARHDDVPDAAVHLERAAHQHPGPDGVPGPGRRALLVLEIDRQFGTLVFAPEAGGAILWQHLFWFFGHPEVYILALPFFGIISEILPVFSRKPIFGYKGLVFATIAIAGLSVAVWAHHMFVTGAVLLPFFAFMTMLIAVPTGVKFFNWIGTMWGGSISFETPMIFSLGFLVTFLFGGLTGIILASPPLDFAVSDSYFVVAHFHYTVFGTVVFLMFAGFYFWWPKFTGKMLDERLGHDPLLAALHRLPGHVPDSALAGCRRDASPVRRLPARGRLHPDEPDLQRRGDPAGPVDADLPVQRVAHPPTWRAGHGRRSRGVGVVHWSGPRRARHRVTTSTRSRASARSHPPSTCITPRSRSGARADRQSRR